MGWEGGGGSELYISRNILLITNFEAEKIFWIGHIRIYLDLFIFLQMSLDFWWKSFFQP